MSASNSQTTSLSTNTGKPKRGRKPKADSKPKPKNPRCRRKPTTSSSNQTLVQDGTAPLGVEVLGQPKDKRKNPEINNQNNEAKMEDNKEQTEESKALGSEFWKKDSFQSTRAIDLSQNADISSSQEQASEQETPIKKKKKIMNTEGKKVQIFFSFLYFSLFLF